MHGSTVLQGCNESWESLTHLFEPHILANEFSSVSMSCSQICCGTHLDPGLCLKPTFSEVVHISRIIRAQNSSSTPASVG
jgi:hypothetical protein